MRVLLVAASSSTLGGGERHVADLLRRLPGRGVQVSLVCPPGGDLVELAADVGVRCETIDIAGMDLPRVLALRKVITTLHPDIVHAHGSRAAFYARLADPRSSRRVVYSLHGIHAGSAGSPLRRHASLAVERVLRAHTALFVAVCRANAEKGAQLGVTDPVRTVVVHNGIEPPAPCGGRGGFRAEMGVAADAPLVLSVGRMDEPKDHKTLLHAFKRLSGRREDARLAIIGAGHLLEQTMSTVAELGLEGSVSILAPRQDIASAYCDADVFVLSSIWEGLPYVVLEAMAHGLTVVSTSVDGVPEVVEDGASGLLVPSSAPDALAEALLRAVSDSGLRAHLGAAARERVLTEFTLERMVDGLLAAYDRVVGMGRGRS